jgi:hypothetical protein
MWEKGVRWSIDIKSTESENFNLERQPSDIQINVNIPSKVASKSNSVARKQFVQQLKMIPLAQENTVSSKTSNDHFYQMFPI